MLKLEVKRAVRKAKNDYINTHISGELDNGNSKPLFNLIKKSRGQANQISSLVNTPSDKIADRLAAFFSTVYRKEPMSPPDLTTPTDFSQSPSLNIDESGLNALIAKLDVRKATGPDGLSAYTLKEFSKHVPKFNACLTKILNCSIKTSTVPDDWKKANICPVFKSGKRDEPSNYRPISLTCVTSKLLEHIISTSMWAHINKNDLLTNYQHGFRKNFSTTTQLLHVAHSASKAINKDKVPLDTLIYKLHKYCFDDQTKLDCRIA